MSDGVNICIAIAVSRAENLDPLPGAITAAHSVIEWATALEYRTRLITDEDGRIVTVNAIKKAILGLIADPGQEIDRVLIAFAGHGAVTGTNDLWLLSKWLNGSDQIINAQLMRRRLFTYRPKQVAIISDACRDPLPAANPALLGRSVLPNSRVPWEGPEPDCDTLLAAGLGKPAYMVRAKENQRAYCLFTHVVTNALWNRYAGAVDDIRVGGPAVTSQTLKSVVRRELVLAANLLNQTQQAVIETNFTPPDDVYTPIGKITPPAAVTLEPPKYIAKAWADAGPTQAEIARDFTYALQQEAPLRPTHFETGTGMAVIGDQIAAVAVPGEVIAMIDTAPGAPSDSRGHWLVLNGPPASLALRLETLNLWVCAAVYPGMIGTFSITDANGAGALIYRPVGNFDAMLSAGTEKAVAALHAGSFSHDDMLQLAAEIPQRTFVDPVLSLIAAYHYARVGNYQCIRNLALYHCAKAQPIPLDMALLAGLRLRRESQRLLAEVPTMQGRSTKTPPAECVVAGSLPWLRQGWFLLDETDEPTLAPLRDFTTELTPALFTTLAADAGDKLSDLIKKGII
jgi:hypothetical protein